MKTKPITQNLKKFLKESNKNLSKKSNKRNKLVKPKILISQSKKSKKKKISQVISIYKIDALNRKLELKKNRKISRHICILSNRKEFSTDNKISFESKTDTIKLKMNKLSDNLYSSKRIETKKSQILNNKKLNDIF